MRTILILCTIYIGTALNFEPSKFVEQSLKYILIVTIVMDLVDFFRGKSR
jgi:hypothetical protein